MIWLTWRQHRAQAVVIYAALAVIAVILAVTGPHVIHLYRTEGPGFINSIGSAYKYLDLVAMLAVLFVPAVVGAFWGAPLIARELEAHTHLLVWNQGVTRGRWLAVKLGLIGLSAVVAAGALSLAFSWWGAPIDAATARSGGGPLPFEPRIAPAVFDTRGVAPIGYAAFAFALGVTLGVLMRRILPAMAVTLAAFLAVQIAVPVWIRVHLASAARLTLPITPHTLVAVSGSSMTINVSRPGAWLFAEHTVDAAGRTVALPSWFTSCLQSSATNHQQSCIARLGALGYRQVALYQPADHYWTLQWREMAIFLAAAAVAGGFCAWWVRRRL